METRLVVERFAIEKIIRAGTDLHGAPEAAIAAPGAARRREDAPEFVEADREFHRIVRGRRRQPDPAAAPRLAARPPEPHGARGARARHDRIRQILEEHRAIAAAVRARDAEGAHRIVGRHLQGTLALLRGGAARVD